MYLRMKLLIPIIYYSNNVCLTSFKYTYFYKYKKNAKEFNNDFLTNYLFIK
jgi:hypothetical protein